ncbi:hypothetical protein PanWU01x14_009030 [Parasponia andersonii]|uniref:Uncharacterized protein n=1 Tax=Parasponia andersonii TaxID=3476 RepID=A0A2P5E2C3_PARAD|nr:hypothetical protein PanWU01x14_009030 [Parasponia andersonii]
MVELFTNVMMCIKAYRITCMNCYFVKTEVKIMKYLKCTKYTYVDFLIWCNTYFVTMACVRHNTDANMHSLKLLACLENKVCFFEINMILLTRWLSWTCMNLRNESTYICLSSVLICLL